MHFGNAECEGDELPYIVECEPRIGAPALSNQSLVVLGVMLLCGAVWGLRRRAAQARPL